MRQRLLAMLLHYANADPPWMRTEFYALKQRLLLKYAEFRGHDLQEIRKDCWGPGTWDDKLGDYDYAGCPGKGCPRCGGDGIFSIKWIRLDRWQWGRYVFHCPSGTSYVKPDSEPQIRGRIEHPDYGRASREAALWLMLLCGEWRLLWKMMGGYSCGRYWWPLLNLNRVVSILKRRLSWRRCWCGRLYPTWGSGWQICKRCRNRKHEPADIPF